MSVSDTVVWRLDLSSVAATSRNMHQASFVTSKPATYRQVWPTTVMLSAQRQQSPGISGGGCVGCVVEVPAAAQAGTEVYGPRTQRMGDEQRCWEAQRQACQVKSARLPWRHTCTGSMPKNFNGKNYVGGCRNAQRMKAVKNLDGR